MPSPASSHRVTPRSVAQPGHVYRIKHCCAASCTDLSPQQQALSSLVSYKPLARSYTRGALATRTWRTGFQRCSGKLIASSESRNRIEGWGREGGMGPSRAGTRTRRSPYITCDRARSSPATTRGRRLLVRPVASLARLSRPSPSLSEKRACRSACAGLLIEGSGLLLVPYRFGSISWLPAE